MTDTPQLVDVFRANKSEPLDKGQFKLVIDDNLTMVLDVTQLGLASDSYETYDKMYEVFLKKITSLNPDEVRNAFKVTSKDISSILAAMPCIGCRISTEKLLQHLSHSGNMALYPLIVDSEANVTIAEEKLSSPEKLNSILHHSSARFTDLISVQFRSKKNNRCFLHSLDSHRIPRPLPPGVWKDIWDSMRTQCKNEVVLIDAATLLLTLETFLHNNRFCAECRVKVHRAYQILMEEPNPGKESGFVKALFGGIKRCLKDKHIHLPIETEYIGNLVRRADAELLNSGGERHAKTLAVAQEEVLCCLGLIVYERLNRIHTRMRDDVSSCHLLSTVMVEALCNKFEMVVEEKKGKSQLEILADELTQAELVKQRRKEHKRLKKKRRKMEKKAQLETKVECDSEDNASGDEFPLSCTCSKSKTTTQSTDRHKLQVLDRTTKGSPTCCCKDCQQRKKQDIPDPDDTDLLEILQQVMREAQKEMYSSGQKNIKSEPATVKQEIRLRGTRNIDKCGIPKLCEAEVLSEEQENILNVSISSDESAACFERSVERVVEQIEALQLSPIQLSPSHSDVEIVTESADAINTKTDYSSNEHSQDFGYASGNNTGTCNTVSCSSSQLNSPLSSELLGPDELYNQKEESHNLQICKHCGEEDPQAPAQEGEHPTLLQMLEEKNSSDEDGQEYFIPNEYIEAYHARARQIMQRRVELRKLLKERFDSLCRQRTSLSSILALLHARSAFHPYGSAGL